ncbi:MAG: 1-(5-phosphoribosyl)-5-[Clostridia bacterium]|nr:1-(5-phosphoribosyl)-5-[(5-phosphoribosylamino)methylideneamino]imidazole-4-carboxamide isomerase [Clostridia bacterium]
MLIFPAIDIYGGRAVRLYKGDYREMTVYSENPLEVALDFRECGAGQMHVVDLEGARTGGTPNLELILKLKKESGLFTEVGGGIRTVETVGKYLENGIDRVILGTAAVENPDFLERSASLYGEKIAVGIDLKDGKVAIKGWTEKTEIDGIEFLKRVKTLGIGTIIVTDISRDGAMRGTNLELYRTLSEGSGVDIIASGGVSSMEDVAALKDLGLYGAIIGKAYYTRAIDLAEAVKAAAGEADL